MERLAFNVHQVLPVEAMMRTSLLRHARGMGFPVQGRRGPRNRRVRLPIASRNWERWRQLGKWNSNGVQ